MAKRKTKASSKTAAPRRTSRRKQGATEGGTSTPTELTNSESNNQEPPSDPPPLADIAPDPQASTSTAPDPHKSDIPTLKPCVVPVVATHKKFGKYRCLFNCDDSFTKKYEMGSDSETSNSMDIKVADPCAGSESDSNAALDTQSDTNSGACYSPSATISLQGGSRDISPVAITRESGPGIPFLTDSDHSESIISLSNHMDDCNEQKLETPEPVPNQLLDINAECNLLQEPQQEDNQGILLEHEHMMYDVGDDDEIITVVQIVEDDHPELYYNIKLDSPKESDQNEEQDQVKLQENEIQKHFESLNLASTSESRSPMDFMEIIDITTPPCTTPDLPYQKEDVIARPDPSITPSSTLSDDSNSSRVTEQTHNDSAESSPSGVRRSSRIKTISNLKQKTKGYGLVKTPLKKALITQTKLKLEELGSDSQDKSVDSSPAPNSPSFPVPSEMPVKVKSRWRRSSELEMVANSPTCSPLASPNLPQPLPPVIETEEDKPSPPLSKEAYDKIIAERINQYQHLEENEYLCDRMISKDTKKMICDCFMTKEELERGELACGEDCLNRLLMIECNSRCPVGDRCTNRRFQKKENGPLKVFYAAKKGCGVEAANDIPTGEFLMEYVGEVLDYEQFYKRAQAYSDDNNLHHYFMSLKGDTVIDATLKGNVSRFINHSCDPNAETQKWTVNGELRIGFFSKRDIVGGEEITFDYQKVAQRCYCGAENCRGWIGAEPDSDDDEYEEEATASAAEVVRPRPPRPKKERKYKPKTPDLIQDADIEEDLEALSRTGVKNQCHTLRLSRTVVRAKSRRAQVALLRLLRDADLPCRRLFLDYRGLRLLAPWCADAPLDFKLEMLQTVDRLPIPNKTMVHESRFFPIFERWMSSTEAPAEQVFIDEATEKPRDLAAILEKVKDLSSQLLERWSSLKAYYHLPGILSFTRLGERVLAAVPPMSKEERRRAFAEAAAAADESRRQRDSHVCVAEPHDRASCSLVWAEHRASLPGVQFTKCTV
ncbi:putative huntingtin interacting protein [Operophtera brumata]|uniref:Putative huntingtin interacting protein n=1 Tax=Operophtera brumata TaxID=104452 RepID=A0A0L7KWA5_OPEBR|nr:putative huntingtin interacting protein [Operophtera brumata]